MTGTPIPLDASYFLIVDDHEFSRHIVRDALRTEGVQNMAIAHDGGSAITQIRDVTELPRFDGITPDHLPRSATDLSQIFGGFDCIISDFNMRPMTGLQLLQAVRTGQTKASRATPVIILTGHSDDNLVAAALALDANAFVVKPVSRNSLISKIRRALGDPVSLKKREAYAIVHLPDPIGGVVRQRSAEPDEQAFVGQEVPDDTDGGSVLLPLAEISGGMTLASDIKGHSGAVLIPGGTRLGIELIEKLTDLEELGGIGGGLWGRR